MALLPMRHGFLGMLHRFGLMFISCRESHTGNHRRPDERHHHTGYHDSPPFRSLHEQPPL
jgi:hypothetical protein